LEQPIKVHEGIQLDERLKEAVPSSFVLYLLGKPGSGKTYFLSQFLTKQEFLGNRFDRILYITPTEISGIVHDYQVNSNKIFDAEWLMGKIEECAPWCENLLIVLDDVVSDIPTNQRNTLQSLLYNRRHVLPKGCISFIFTSQKYTALPLWIRVCVNCFVSFGIPPNEITEVKKELNTGKDSRSLSMLYRDLKRHSFLLFNLETGKAFN